MAISTVNIGSAPNDGTGDPLRTAFNKLNTNFLNITADGGDEITVVDPTTSTDATLNDALANIYASGGATPDLQAVTDEGATTTNPITVQDNTEYFTEVVNDGNRITSKDIASGNKFWEVGAAGDLTLAQYSGADADPVQYIQFNNSGDLNQIFRVPNKPTGDYTLATTDDIPTLDATPTNGSTNGVESNGVFDALATKVNASRFVHNGETSITGTSSESNICSFKIDGGAYSANDGFKFDFTQYKGTTAGTITYRAYVGTTSGARTNQILASAITGANRAGDVTRRYYIDGGSLDCAVPFTSNAQSGLSGFGSVNTPISVNMANDLWITITAQGQTSGETVGILGASITPLK